MQDSARLFFYTLIMIKDFSQQLIEDTRAYFSTLYQKEISEEEAERFLKSLISLTNSFLEN